MSSFAKAQLLKYGWTEGKGLGKNENGIVQAIRPKLKFDTKGIGHSDKEHKWWESVYDKASSGIKIEASKPRQMAEGVEESDAVRIVAEKIRSDKSAKSLRYGKFLKSCTLDDGKIVAEEDSGGWETEVAEYDGAAMELTDEQLFRACGGRTAHKGARHGLKLNGKLARVARQEAQLLGISPEAAASDEWTVAERKRTRKRKRRRSESEMVETTAEAQRQVAKVSDAEEFSPAVVESDSERPKKSKKSRRKEKRRFQELASKLNDFSIIEDESRPEMAGKIWKGSNVRSEDVEDDSDALQRPRKRKNLSEAERLNHRIDKKKRKASAKSAEKRVEKMSDCLMAVNLNEDSGDSGNPTSPVHEATKKMKKRRRNRKGEKSRKIISIIELEG